MKTEHLQFDKAIELLDMMKGKRKEANTRLMLASGFFLGLRISDILKLTWEHLTVGAMEKFTIIETKTGKKKICQVAPMLDGIAKDTMSLMSYEPKPKDFVFIGGNKGTARDKPISDTAARKRLKRTFEKYKIETTGATATHVLRKTFARRIYDVSKNKNDAIVKLMSFLNHSSPQVTLTYIGITDEENNEIFNSAFVDI